MLMEGTTVNIKKKCNIDIQIEGNSVPIDCLVLKDFKCYELILGMDFIQKVGGVYTNGQDVQLCWKKFYCNTIKESLQDKCEDVLKIDDVDFSAVFMDNKWVVDWNWCENEPELNGASLYKIPVTAYDKFDAEIQKWIENGWLKPYSGDIKVTLPLMAVIQQNKDKVRPVLDYRRFNSFLSPHTAESDVCSDKLREWRKLGENVRLLDLKDAYLQIHVHPSKWKFQVVKYKGQTFCLTRLGFGISIAPKIMTAIVKKVLAVNPDIEQGTDSYIDDIIVNENVVDAGKVKDVLSEFGLKSKEIENLEGTRVLGLRLSKRKFGLPLEWNRDNKINLEASYNEMSKRDLFSFCGKLIGHFPIAGWLRPACSYIKRLCNDIDWNDKLSENVKECLKDIIEGVKKSDPVKGHWEISNSKVGNVWCDASSLAVGCCVEIGGKMVEDASWIRKQNDSGHINLAELDAVVKGVSLAIKYGLEKHSDYD